MTQEELQQCTLHELRVHPLALCAVSCWESPVSLLWLQQKSIFVAYRESVVLLWRDPMLYMISAAGEAETAGNK